MKYYMAIRINALFNIRELPNRISYKNAPYYEYAVDTIRKCYHYKDFPNMNSKVIYSYISFPSYLIVLKRIQQLHMCHQASVV